MSEETDRLVTRTVAEAAIYEVYSHSGLKIRDLEGNVVDEKTLPTEVVDAIVMLDRMWVVMIAPNGDIHLYSLAEENSAVKLTVEGATRIERNPSCIDLLFFTSDQKLKIHRGASKVVYETEGVVDAAAYATRVLVSTADELRLYDYAEKKTLRAFDRPGKIDRLLVGERLMMFIEGATASVIDDNSRLERLTCRSGSRIVDAVIDGQMVYLMTDHGVELWDLTRRDFPKLRTIHWPIMVGDETPLSLSVVSDQQLQMVISPGRAFPIERATPDLLDRLDRFGGLNLAELDDELVARITSRPSAAVDETAS